MRILLALDDSSYAETVLQGFMGEFLPKGNEIRVLHVIEPLPSIYGGAEWGYVADWRAAAQEQRKQAEALVAQAAHTLRQAGFSAGTAIEEGSPKAVILDYAANWPAELILLGSHGRRGLERFLLGSVSEGVARHAPCSVQIIRKPGQRVASSRIAAD